MAEAQSWAGDLPKVTKLSSGSIRTSIQAACCEDSSFDPSDGLRGCWLQNDALESEGSPQPSHFESKLCHLKVEVPLRDSSSENSLWAHSRRPVPPPLTHFPPERSVLGSSVEDVGEPFHVEGRLAPLAFHVGVHLPAPGIPHRHSCWAAHPSPDLPAV